LFTVTLLEEDQVRVNVMPKKLADGENAALTIPMSFTGTAEELDTQLPSALVSYVARCLVPAFDGAYFSREWKEALWARFYTGAPPRQRRSVERYNIVKRA
jgi:hypothetical protein